MYAIRSYYESQVLNILKELQKEFDLTYLFIAHNLSVVEHISDRVAVMYLGKMVELTDRDELFRQHGAICYSVRGVLHEIIGKTPLQLLRWLKRNNFV